MRLRPGVPVLARPDGALQVGIARPVTLTALDPDAATFVTGLEGRSTRVSAREAETHAALLDSLRAAGLTAPDGAPETRVLAEAAVRIRGVTEATRACALTLARAGVGSVGATTGRGDATTDACGRLHRDLAEAAPGIRVTAPFAPARLDVVAGHGAVDPVVARDLTARDLPHLPVVTDDAGVTIGPLVVPGESPCLRCADLSRCDEDPGWAAVAIQLAAGARPAPIRPDTAALAGAVAAREALRFLTGEPDSGVAVRVEDDRSGAATALAPLAAHPDCGCGA